MYVLCTMYQIHICLLFMYRLYTGKHWFQCIICWGRRKVLVPKQYFYSLTSCWCSTICHCVHSFKKVDVYSTEKILHLKGILPKKGLSRQNVETVLMNKLRKNYTFEWKFELWQFKRKKTSPSFRSVNQKNMMTKSKYSKQQFFVLANCCGQWMIQVYILWVIGNPVLDFLWDSVVVYFKM